MITSLSTATAADAADYRAIRLEALKNAPGAFGMDFADVVQQPLAYWSRLVSTIAHLVLARDAEGMVVGTASGDDFVYPGVRGLGLYGMYVTPRYRGTGLASELALAVGEWAQHNGARRLHLHVTAGNARAEQFYRRMGFVPVNRFITMPRDRRIILNEMTAPLPLTPS